MQLFTVDQANRTLPLVRRIAEDVVRAYGRRAETLVVRDLRATGRGDDAADATAAALEREIKSLDRELEGYARELHALGIQLKDPRTGLVDFPANLDGRRVLLCWRLGEPAVQFWHDEHSGFAGRQPLSPTLVG